MSKYSVDPEEYRRAVEEVERDWADLIFVPPIDTPTEHDGELRPLTDFEIATALHDEKEA